MTNNKFNFEKAINELENLIDKMEENELSLDESIALFEQGSILIKQCSKKLHETEKKIQILLKEDNGEEHIEDFKKQPTQNNTPSPIKPPPTNQNALEQNNPNANQSTNGFLF